MVDPAALNAEARARIDRYLAELTEWGARINLVGSTEIGALSRHVADSLAAASWLPTGARVADLGSGAGFPGVPIAITRPDLEVVLVEVRERRAHFLRHVVRTLGLGCCVMRERLEVTPERPFEVTLVRALARLPRALQLAAPWTRPGGEIWLWTREKWAPGGAQVLVGEISLDERGRILRLQNAAGHG